MKTVKEVSAISGVSVRTLHHYDEIGLLHPSAYSDAGYRLYDENAMERLQHILLFRALRFSYRLMVFLAIGQGCQACGFFEGGNESAR